MAILKILGKLGAALAMSMAIDEIKAGTQSITQMLVSFAVSRLPLVNQKRYEEEWSSYIANIPGRVWPLFQALGLVRAAFGISRMTMPNPNRKAATQKHKRTSFLYRILVATMGFQMEMFKAAQRDRARVETSGQAQFMGASVIKGGIGVVTRLAALIDELRNSGRRRAQEP